MSVVSLNLDFSLELSLPPILSMAFVFPGALDILYSVCLTVGAEPSAASVAMTLSVVQFGRAFCCSVPFPICFSPFTGPGPSDGCVTVTYLSFFVFLLEQSLPPLCRWILFVFCFCLGSACKTVLVGEHSESKLFEYRTLCLLSSNAIRRWQGSRVVRCLWIDTYVPAVLRF